MCRFITLLYIIPDRRQYTMGILIPRINRNVYKPDIIYFVRFYKQIGLTELIYPDDTGLPRLNLPA